MIDLNAQLTRKAALREILPTAFGYIGVGLAFGIVGKAAGLSPWMVGLLSTIVYAGSAQFITVSMLLAHSSVLAIVAATFLVNARMLLMSMTLARYLKHESYFKNIVSGTLLTDESFALAINKLNFTDQRLNFEWLNAANWFGYLTWIASTVIGALLGSILPNPAAFGVDFAIVAMFLGLLYLQVIADKSLPYRLQVLVIALTCLLVYIGLIFIPSTVLILIVTLIGCAIGVSLKNAFF